MNTLFEEITGWMYFQQNKHEHLRGWHEDSYPEQLVNEMSQFELLYKISEYLEERLSKEE